MSDRHVINVVQTPDWKIEYKGSEFGPYGTREKAIETARLWAHNARKQGHLVEVAIVGSEAPTPTK